MASLSQTNLLRDVFNRRSIGALARSIGSVWTGFDRRGFEGYVFAGLEAMGFGERSRRITEALSIFLPGDFVQAAPILIDALGPELGPQEMAPLDSFVVMPQCAYISARGRKHFDLSMRALYEMTKRFSAEGDLRTFIEVDYEKSMQVLRRWIEDPSPHVRRLVSEGTRPRLPLASRIRRFQRDPRPVLGLLEQLRHDPSEYVRRSVANNLNDISKDHPDLVVRTLRRWARAGEAPTAQLIRHASRSLIKQGHAGALALVGCSHGVALRVLDLTVAPTQAHPGDDIRMSFTLVSEETRPEKLVVDYALHFRKANGSLSPKVFKLRSLTLHPGARIAITRRLALRPTSGRSLYPGRHEIEILVNGQKMGRAVFHLLP